MAKYHTLKVVGGHPFDDEESALKQLKTKQWRCSEIEKQKALIQAFLETRFPCNRETKRMKWGGTVKGSNRHGRRLIFFARVVPKFLCLEIILLRWFKFTPSMVQRLHENDSNQYNREV